MMDVPLLISTILEHAVDNNPDQLISTALDTGTMHQYTYTDFNSRVRRLAGGLRNEGIETGSRVATIAWNTYRHLEIYYATAGIGAICHTINPRLHIDQIAFVINDAKDQVLFYDPHFQEIVAELKERCSSVAHWVVLREDEGRDTSEYAGWLPEEEPGFAWPTLDERSASGLCYTSGTTGDPKGALYSHRSTVLHAYASCHADALGISCSDTVLPVVPMFHVNAWGLPYSALLSGAALVLPGANLKGQAIYKLCERARVTLTAGVPTVWQGVLDHVEANGLQFSTLRQIMIGGSTCPPSMIKSFASRNVAVRHAWGMTEVSPLGTVCRSMPCHEGLDEEHYNDILASQGRPLFGAMFKLVDDCGSPVPKNGVTQGHLMIRGPWVIERYFGKTLTALTDGWFQTGDVATIDRLGYLRIKDRSKDVIKSGGEWISSIDIENIAVEHPAVLMAACIAEPHDKWGERPLLIVVPRSGATVSGAEILRIFVNRVPSWSVPDRVQFVEAIPMTATGKIQKRALRDICLGNSESAQNLSSIQK